MQTYEESVDFRVALWKLLTRPRPNGRRYVVDYLRWLATMWDIYAMDASEGDFDMFLRARFNASVFPARSPHDVMFPVDTSRAPA